MGLFANTRLRTVYILILSSFLIHCFGYKSISKNEAKSTKRKGEIKVNQVETLMQTKGKDYFGIQRNLRENHTYPVGDKNIYHGFLNASFDELIRTSPPKNWIFDIPCKIINVIVDCSGLSLQTIHSSWFPDYTEIILLMNNQLSYLENSTFANLTRLKQLDLSNNIINQIDIDAFDGLNDLQILSLSYNKINLSVLGNIFKPTRNLQELNLIQKDGYNFDPHNFSILEPLSKLQTLSLGVDNENLYFSPVFRNLVHLNVLRITGYLKNMNERSFENLIGLEKLYIENLENLNNISQNAFEPLKKLIVFSVVNIPLDVQYVLLLLKTFHGRNMTEISLDTVNPNPTQTNPMKNGFLTSIDTQYVKNICVQSFQLTHCNVFFVTIDAFKNSPVWDNCLLNFDFSFNPVVGIAYSFVYLFCLTNLNYFTVTNALRACSNIPPFPHQLKNNEVHETLEATKKSYHSPSGVDKWRNDRPEDLKYLAYNHPNATSKHLRPILNVCVSKKLKAINARRLIRSQSLDYDVIFQGAESLELIDMGDSGLFNFIGHIEGLPTLKTVIFSGNDVSTLSESFFDNLIGLEKLAMSACQLDKDFISVYSGRTFRNLPKLKELDLSLNLLNLLSRDTFSYNPHLQWLNLSGNQFREIPFSLKNTPELAELDLSNNALSSIDVSVSMELDQLVLKSGTFHLYLSSNILSCTCSDLHFLHWMKFTLIKFDQNGNFSCMNKDGERTYTSKYTELEYLWRQCWGQFFLSLALILFCLYFIGFFIVFLLMRNKNYVLSYFLQLLGGYKLNTRLDYNFDVYIGYSETDYQFSCKDLRGFIENSFKFKTFLSDRDMIASIDKASGIIDAINDSWRVVLVCNESFLKDDSWSMFTMRSAMYSLSPANPAKVVVIVHKDFLPLLPTELLSAVNDESIIVISKWELTYELKQKLTTRLHK